MSTENKSNDTFYYLILLLKNWYWILIIISISLALGLYVAISKENVYRSDVLLLPTNSGSNSLASMGGELGGLASIAGINLGSSGSNNVKLAIEILKSRKFMSDIIKNHNLLPILLASESWTGKPDAFAFNFNTEIYDGSEWNAEFLSKNGPPSIPDAYKKVMESMNITEDFDSGLIEISFKHVNPYFARFFLETISSEINSTMRKRDLQEAIESKEYLNKQLKTTVYENSRSLLFQMLEESEQKRMLAQIREEYIFSIVDPASLPHKKFEPKRSLIVLVFFLLSLILSIIFVILKRQITNFLSVWRTIN